MLRRLRGELQWRAKGLAQFVLARLPFAEAINFRLGELARPMRHRPEGLRQRLPGYLSTLAKVHRVRPVPGARVFELGTGWCPLVPVVLHAGGAAEIITVDKVPHLRFPLARAAIVTCQLEADQIAALFGIPVATVQARLARLAEAPDLPSFLAAAAIRYLAPADAQATGLPAASVDIWYSYSVLENIPIPVVEGIVAESARITRSTGVVFSVIGCRDPFAAGVPGMNRVNYLRYSDRVWGFWAYNALAYNNRMREVDFTRMMQRHGLRVQEVEGTRDPHDLRVLADLKVDARFAGYSHDELAVHRTEITALPPAAS